MTAEPLGGLALRAAGRARRRGRDRRRPAASRSPAAAQAPGSVTRIARRAPQRVERRRPPRRRRSPRRARSGRSAWTRAAASSGDARAVARPLGESSATRWSTRVDDAVDLGHARSGGSWPRRRTARVARARSRIVPIGSRPLTSGRTLGDRRRRWARTSGRPSSQTGSRPPVERPAVARVDDGAAAGRDHPADARRRDRPGRGRATAARSRARNAASPSSAKISGIGPAGARLDPLVEVDERRAVAAGQPPADDALAAARQPDSTTSTVGLSRRRRSRPRRCRSGRASRRRPPRRSTARGPPATGGSGAVEIRAR